ncbi:MAG: hypothetical protein Q27BB25_06820 [Blastomonas sp. CACIA14H2]|uniref:DUF1109 domain-containing protein n=1 Tax=Blastomonas sp. CACIA14H2 TaxID=1419876 RepID=UPI0003D06C4D|nr:MAG: hypothetical protein Q27BB25_06820 [Blastomonas sp. CACIA14H2]
MNQAALIEALCQDLTPVPPVPAAQVIARGTLIGGGVSLLAVLAAWGVQPGIGHGTALPALLLKAAAMIALAGLALRSLAALSRPGLPPAALLPGLGAVVAALGFVALGQMLVAHQAGAERMLFGTTWQACPWRIFALSLPLLGGIFRSLRGQAPVHLRQTGAAAGLLAGSIAAALYALACTEQSAAFVLCWYGLGIGGATLAGALCGPRFLRW